VAVIVGAVQRAIRNLLSLDRPLGTSEHAKLSAFTSISTKNKFDVLGALMDLHSHPSSERTTNIGGPELVIWQLVDTAWMYTFPTYFRLKRKEAEKGRMTETGYSVE
jgi:hypothetical protein